MRRTARSSDDCPDQDSPVSAEKSTSSFLPMIDPLTPAKDKAPTIRGRAACMGRRVIYALDPTNSGRFYFLTTVLLLLYILAHHARPHDHADVGDAFVLPPATPPALVLDSSSLTSPTPDASAAALAVPAADVRATFADGAPAEIVGVATVIVSGQPVPAAADALPSTASTPAAAAADAATAAPDAGAAGPPNPPPAPVPSPLPPPKSTWQLPPGSACTSEHKGDSKVSSCESICNPKFAKGHCSRCKCRACDFCPKAEADPAAAVPATSAAADGALSTAPAAGVPESVGPASSSGSDGGAGSNASAAGDAPGG